MGLCFWRDIVHGQNYSIHLQYIPFAKYLKNTLGSITYLLKLGGYCIALPKLKSKVIPYLGHSINTMG
jgi:hypothetical protein